MVSLYCINPESVFDGQQRSLEDFQFDLENVLTLSQLVGKSAEERNAAAVLLDILVGTKNKTAAEVATDATRNRQGVLYAVLATNTAGRANVIVRDENTKNGAWAQSPPEAGHPLESAARVKKLAYGLNDALRRWWNILDKALCGYGMVPTRADRCSYVLDSTQTRERNWNQQILCTAAQHNNTCAINRRCNI